MISDYYKLRRLLKDHLKIEVSEIVKNELKISIKFDDEVLTSTKFKK